MELQDSNLASTMREQQKRVREFWEKNWVPRNQMLHSIKCSSYLTTFIYPLINGAACLF